MAAGAVAEVVAGELDQVADDVVQIAAATRRLDSKVLGSLGIGLTAGAVLGVYFGYKYSKKKLRNEIYAEAEKDIEMIRDHYQSKIIAAEHSDKPSVAEIVQERGYATPEDLEVRSTDPPSVVHFPTEISSASSSDVTSGMVSEERRNSPVSTNEDPDPYVITEAEFLPNESGYSQVNYTYYSNDDVLVDDADPTNILSGRQELIGRDAILQLARTDGNGTVYVRNPHLELEMLIEYVPKSWDEEVLGLDNEPG